MKTAIIAFGSNLDKPQEQVQHAAQCVASLPDIHSFLMSPLYRTTPVGYADQPDFINAVAQIQTTVSAEELLVLLQQIEQKFGRVRSFANAPRTLDLDMIDYDHQIMHTDTLQLPHPRAHLRGFVMLPLAHIAPDYVIGTHGTAAELATQLGKEGIEIFNSPFQAA